MATKKHQVESKIEILSNFKISKNWYGKNKVVIVNFNNGRYANITYQYNHDDVYKNTISHLEKLNCWSKYGYYSSSNNIPKWAKEFVTET